MKLVLDTDALWHGELLQRLAELEEAWPERARSIEAVVPGIAWAERLRQIGPDGELRSAVEGAVEDSGARLEAFGQSEAERLAGRQPRGAAWRDHARDFLIAAHVHGDRVAVTRDQGPTWGQVERVTPDQAAELVGELVG